MTDCPICYNTITKETGITTLSCSHSFHLQCVATWLLQVNTCPYCRGEVGEYENIMDMKIYPDPEDTFIDYWSSDYSVPILELPPQIQRILYSTLDPTAPIFYPRTVAAVKIQALIRGFITRLRAIAIREQFLSQQIPCSQPHVA